MFASAGGAVLPPEGEAASPGGAAMPSGVGPGPRTEQLTVTVKDEVKLGTPPAKQLSDMV